MGERSHDGHLSGDVDVLTFARQAAVGERCQSTHSRFGSYPHGRLWLGDAHRFAVFFASQRHRAAESHDFQICSLKIPVGALLPVRRDGNQNQARDLLFQVLISEPPVVQRARWKSL